MPGCQRYTPLAQKRIRKNYPLTTRVAPIVVDEIEAIACALGIPRQHILKAAIQFGIPLAIAALTAKDQDAGKE